MHEPDNPRQRPDERATTRERRALRKMHDLRVAQALGRLSLPLVREAIDAVFRNG